MVALFSWMVLHVPIKQSILVNKHTQKDGYVHLPFTNEKLLLLLFSFCSLGTLDSSIFERRSFYSEQSWAKHTKQTTSTTKNNTPKQKKGLKRTYRKIGLVATVTRTQETQKTELRLKRYNY